MGDKEITVHRGDYRTINITVYAGTTIQVITGATLWLTVKKDPENELDAAAVLQKDGEVVSGDNGTAKFDLDKDDTDITPGTYTYDIQIRLSDEKNYTLAKDNFKVIQDVTTTTTPP